MAKGIYNKKINAFANYDFIAEKQDISGGHKWIIKIYKYRPNDVVSSSTFSVLNVSLTAGSITQPASTVSFPTPLPSGTYNIKYGNTDVSIGGTTSIPSTASENNIKAGLIAAGATVDLVSVNNQISKWEAIGRFQVEVWFESVNFSTVETFSISNPSLNVPIDKISGYRMPGGRYGAAYPVTLLQSFIPSAKSTVRVQNNGIYAFA